jgi:DNA mismatch endonuclease (patch repair protein)
VADIMSPKQRSRVMSRIRGKNTTPERYIRSLLNASGLQFRQHLGALPGRPDFAFADEKVAVFVNGDFWHGWRFPVWRHRLPSFWRNKITGNRERDRRNLKKLRRLGWKVLRIWEHQVELDPIACVARITRALGEKSVDWHAIRTELHRMPVLKRRNRLPKP